MTKIEQMKTRSELLRVQAAMAELEYVVEQRLEEIQRIQGDIQKQKQTELILTQKLKGV
jgi:hypothetical protein